MKDKILNWFATGRVGMSSKAMACCLVGAECDCSHPYDPDDLNRCLLFLSAVPEAREHMDKFAAMSTAWAMLIERWSEIEKCFLDEVGLDWCKATSAKKTYDLMDKILTEARIKEREKKHT